MAFPERAESWRSKAHLSGARLPVLVGVTALALIALLAGGSLLLKAATFDGFSVTRAMDEDTAKAPDETSAAEVDALIVVHVGGAVAEPGVRELSEGSRVQDAVDAAGGFTDAAAHDALNLARVLTDGEQVVVPTVEEAAAASTSSVGSVGGKININTASAVELDALPGVGPSTAEKIIADREANGPFAAPEDLMRVAGIGDKKYAELADAICIG